jgi:uncharacterized protein YifE (UPF0438 family)
MLAKDFEHFMKNNKFKKKFSDRLRKAPHTTDTEEAEKKDPRGPQCFECSGFGHIRTKCANLKKQRGKAFNATLSDESEKEEETPEEEKFLAFVAHMKIRRILSPTTLRIVKKKICSQPINFNMLNS